MNLAKMPKRAVPLQAVSVITARELGDTTRALSFWLACRAETVRDSGMVLDNREHAEAMPSLVGSEGDKDFKYIQRRGGIGTQGYATYRARVNGSFSQRRRRLKSDVVNSD